MARHDPDFMNAASQRCFNVSGSNIDLQFGYFYDDEIYDVSEESPYRPTFDKGIYIATEGNAYIGMCLMKAGRSSCLRRKNMSFLCTTI